MSKHGIGYVFAVASLAACMVAVAPAEVIFEPGPGAEATVIVTSGCVERAPAPGESTVAYDEASECSINGVGFDATARAENAFTVLGSRDDVTSITVDTASEYSASRSAGARSLESAANVAISASITLTTPMVFEATGSSSASANQSPPPASSSVSRASANIVFREESSSNSNIGSFSTARSGQDPQVNDFMVDGILQPGSYVLLCFVQASGELLGGNGIGSSSASASSAATMQITFSPVPPTGGCCIDGFCDELTREACDERNGVYAGDDQDCKDCVVEACDQRWINDTGGSFRTAANWEPAQVPRDNGDGCANLILGLPGEYTVTFGTSSGNALFVRDGTVGMSGTRLALSGRPSAGNGPGPLPPALGVGNGAVLFLSGGEIVADTAVIGDSDTSGSGTSSRVTVSGNGARLDVAEGLVIGDVMDGTLTVTDFGKVDSGNAVVGRMEVANSVGSDVNVKAGGDWTNNELTVGLSSPGLVTLREDGGMVSNAATLGVDPGVEGEVRVVDKASDWRVMGQAVIGDEGTGTLTIEELGIVSVESMIVGAGEGGSGSIIVRGATTLLETSLLQVETDDLVLGNGGTGTLALLDGGVLRAAGDFVVGAAGPLASFLVDGAQNDVTSAMALAGHLRVGTGAAVAQVAFDNGGTGAAGTATIGDGAPGQLIISNSGRFVAMSNEEETHFGILNVGNRAVGTVVVESEGELQADGILMGSGGTGVGTLTLRNATAVATRIGITVGSGGNGATMTIEGASTVRSASTFFVGASGGKASVSLAGDSAEAPAQLIVSDLLGIGILATEASIVLTRNATITANEIVVGGLAPGLLAILENSVVTAPTTRVSSDGLLIGDVTLPGKQAGAADEPNIVGDLIVEEGGRVRVSAGSAPAIRVAGNATLNGTLEVEFDDEAGLSAGMTVRLLHVAGTTTGAFTEVSFPTRDATFAGDISVENGTLVLAVTNPGTPIGGEGEGEGEGELPGMGCPASKSDVVNGLNKALGDLFLMALALLTLTDWPTSLQRR